MDLVIRNARVLTLDDDDTEYAEADIVVSGRRIVGLGPGAGAAAEGSAGRVVDGRGLLAMPGLINGHFHSPGNFMKGAVANTPLELFMLYEVPPLMDRPATPRFAYVRTLLGILEMLKQGVTAVHDDAFFIPYPTDGELDAALIVEPPFALPKTCEWRVVHTEPMVLIAPEKMRGRDARDLLTNEPFIRYDRKHWGGRLADDCLRAARIQPHERFELDALGAIAVLVSRELGVSLVPDWAPPWPSGLRLIKLKPPGPAVSRKIGLVWSRTSPRGRLAQTFLQEMKLAMRSGDAAKASASELRRKAKR